MSIENEVFTLEPPIRKSVTLHEYKEIIKKHRAGHDIEKIARDMDLQFSQVKHQIDKHNGVRV